MKRILSITCTGLGLLLSGSLGHGTTIFDDFDDGEDVSPGWTLVDASLAAGGPAGTRSFGLDNMSYRLQAAALASARLDFTMQDGTARVDLIQWDPVVSGGSSVGLLVRFNPQTLSGYFLSIDFDGNPNLNLVTLNQGQPGANAEGPTKIYDQTKTYTLEAVTEGDTITGRVYENDNGTVTLFDEVVLTESTYPAGVTGLLTAQDSFPESLAPGDATFDNFFATDGVIAEPSLVSLNLNGETLEFGVTREPGRAYTVEYKDGVGAAGWNSLTNFAPMSLSGINEVTDDTSEPQRIYRATTPAE